MTPLTPADLQPLPDVLVVNGTIYDKRKPKTEK